MCELNFCQPGHCGLQSLRFTGCELGQGGVYLASRTVPASFGVCKPLRGLNLDRGHVDLRPEASENLKSVVLLEQALFSCVTYSLLQYLQILVSAVALASHACIFSLVQGFLACKLAWHT